MASGLEDRANESGDVTIPRMESSVMASLIKSPSPVSSTVLRVNPQDVVCT